MSEGMFIAQERELSVLSLGELYEVTMGGMVGGAMGEESGGEGGGGGRVLASDFHKYRARQLLDAVMAHLQSL